MAEQVADYELDESALLAAIVESSDDAIISMDLSGTIKTWNRAAEDMYGFTADEAVGRPIEITLPPERQAEEPTFLDRIKRGERIVGFETVRRRKDGSTFPVSLTISPICHDRSTVIGASKSARDITERKRESERAAFLAEAGAVLSASLEYLTTLKTVANLAVPAIADWCAVDILTDEHKLERLAAAHVDPAKIDLAREIRSRYEDPNSPYSPPYVVRTGAPAMIRELTDEMIEQAARGDAERIALVRSLGVRSYIIVPLTARGRTFGALTFASGESGRLYADDDFRFARDVAFRAALAVDNARAFEDAQTANRLKDEFLATLSHELRTPLNAILGYARLLQSSQIAPDRHAHALVTVERNASALTQIVEDILDVSRIVSGKIRLNIQPVDLPQVVKSAVETMVPAAEAKQIRLQTMLDPRAGPISGDPDRLQQVVWNLVSNAVKFTPKQGIVQVRLERVNSHVEVVVSDTGIGIAPDFLPHIFERFRQADSGTTRAHAGIGLGLAIARHLVELHGGTIHAVSGGTDQGSTFRVRLPLMIVHLETSSERRSDAERAAPDASGPAPRLDGLCILAVDDDGDARALVTETLEAAGATVTTVESGVSALEAIALLQPDVLLADIGMVETDGFEVIRRVRASSDPRVRDIPAAALTAYARADDRIKALQAGFQMHLAKPVAPDELIVAVAALSRQRPR
jgi:PAS domain S-box-containing protein